MKPFNIKKYINEPLKIVCYDGDKTLVTTKQAYEKLKLKFSREQADTHIVSDLDPTLAPYLTDFSSILTEEEI